MYLKQGDLFWGMSKDFVKEAMDNATKISHNEGEALFRDGDKAGHFYILIKGRVMLSLGDKGPMVYMARHPGEIIGWSSLAGRETYSASASCMEPTNLIRINKDDFLASLEKNSENGYVLYRRLARMLGNRLIELYPSIV